MLMLLVLLGMGITSCKKDEPVDMALVSLLAGDIDLNGATAPDNIPTEPVITATFTANVDMSTATAANITLTQQYDGADIPLTISVSGSTITITPESTLGTGTLFQLDLKAGIESTDAKPLTALTRSFTTNGTFAPAGVIAHWTFENNADDVVGNYDPSANGIVNITYTASRNAEAGMAATFDGDASIIEIPNGDQLINTADFTISFWVKTNSEGHVDANGNPAGQFVLGLGAFYGIEYEIYGAYDGGKFAVQYDFGDGTSGSEDMWFPSLATDNTNGGWQGWTYAKSLTAEQMQAMLKDTWLNVVFTFEHTTKVGTLYYNGEKMKSFDFNLWDATDKKHGVVGLKWGGTAPDVLPELAFGFIQSRGGTLWDTEAWGGYDFPTANHFKGQLDDVRIFHKAISATEVQLMYDSEKP
jgi:hypothetical protein